LQNLEKKGDIFSITLEGHRNTLYAPIEDRPVWEDPPAPDTDTLRFLAPLDPLIWSRALFKAVYGQKYVWEVYKKPKDRIYGYYCLPILFNGEYVGLIEPYHRNEDNILEIRGFHIIDKDINKERFMLTLLEELKRFRDYLKAERIEDLSSHPFLTDIT
jgi:uncharacterized protein YcaQ